jgi:hypothetical protein
MDTVKFVISGLDRGYSNMARDKTEGKYVVPISALPGKGII